VTQQELAEQILRIAIGTGDEHARGLAIIDLCSAAEAGGMLHEDVIATIVVALVSGCSTTMTALLAVAADEPRGQILR
jgi:Na+-transporting NADH:ubiquinone oxidoreductase subunit NqrD